MESVLLTTSDGHQLPADLTVPADGPIYGAPGVAVCHPHPRYGGDRFNPIVDAVYRRLPAAGLATLRFDFRRQFDGGIGEQNDVIAAIDELDRRTGGDGHVVVGYSFGAVVALTTTDERIRGVVAIAPPLTEMPTIAPPSVPVLVLTPQHDQFTPPDAARGAVEGWPSVEVRTVESADHFLLGRAAAVADSVADWLVARR
ncbi:MAG: hypothetical protein R8G01_05835 [Ilumatobacteraceae bacterium]|nr:hypothetical protein [Ilumatobacteraceae bacterium]